MSIAATPRAGDATQNSVLVPILLIILAVSLFSCGDTLAKLLRESALPATEIAWLRYIVFVVYAMVLAARGGVLGWRCRRPGLQLARGVAVLGSAILFIMALGHLPIADATAINFVSPAFITALSMLILREQVGMRRWAAVLVGLIGVLIVVRPGAGAFQPAAVLPITSAACWAAAIVITRRMGVVDRTETTLLWSAVSGFLLLSITVFFGFTMPSLREIGIAFAMGVCSATAQYLVIVAYTMMPASLLAPFSYVQILTSTALGFAVFGAVPDRATFLGAAIIVASGLYTAHRERVRMRARITSGT
ncbi:MAG: DMT family transporter [Rhodospirillales bacterium]|nr:DMT family transporter [Rhodospirillales bacterium]